MDVDSAENEHIEIEADIDSSKPHSDLDVNILPTINNGNIPLSQVIDRIVAYAYSELLNLIETFSSKSNENKKASAIEYTFQMRQAFVKLITIVRWAKNASDISKAQRITAFLQEQNRKIIESFDDIYGIGIYEARNRVRNYDLLSAIQVLKTGAHNCFSVDILKKYIESPSLDHAEKMDIIKVIEDEIGLRLVRGEPLPNNMNKYTIKNACVTFTVPQEFEVSLTSLQIKQQVPWHIVSLKILAQGDSCLSGELKPTVSAKQINRMISLSQDILIKANNDISSGTSIHTENESNKPGEMVNSTTLPPLVQLYDFLHMCCLNISLEIFYSQSTVLAQTRYSQHLHPEIDKERTSLLLKYWVSGASPSAALPRSSLLGMDQLVSGSKHRGKKANQNLFVPAENYLKIQIVELPQPKTIHPPNLNSSFTLPRKLVGTAFDGNSALMQKLADQEKKRVQLVTKSALFFEWVGSSGLNTQARKFTFKFGSSTDQNSSDFENILQCLPLNLEEINTENLINVVQKYHAQLIVKDLCKTVSESGVLMPGDIELVTVGDINNSDGNIISDMCLNSFLEENNTKPILGDTSHSGDSLDIKQLILRLWYRSKESAIDISVDVTTGKLLVKAYSENVSGTNSVTDLEILNNIAKSLNQSSSKLLGLLLELRSLLTMSDIEQLALKTPGVLPISTKNNNRVIKLTPTSKFPLRLSIMDNEAILKYIFKHQGQNKTEILLLAFLLDFSYFEPNNQKREWFILITMDQQLRFFLAEFSTSFVNDSSTKNLENIFSLQVSRIFDLLLKYSEVPTNYAKDIGNPEIFLFKDGNENLGVYDNTTEFKTFKPNNLANLAMLEGRSRIPFKFLGLLSDVCLAYIYTQSIQIQISSLELYYTFNQSYQLATCFSENFRDPPTANSFHGGTNYSSIIDDSSLEALRSGLSDCDLQIYNSAIYIPIRSLAQNLGAKWCFFNNTISPEIFKDMLRLKIEYTAYVNNFVSSSHNLLAHPSSFGLNRYFVSATIPVSKINLPGIVIESLMQSSLSKENIPDSAGVTSLSKALPHTIFLNREYYYLESCINDLVCDWLSLTTILNVVKKSVDADIKGFLLGDFRKSNSNIPKRKSMKNSDSKNHNLTQNCKYCGLHNIYSPALLIDTGIPCFYLSIYFGGITHESMLNSDKDSKKILKLFEKLKIEVSLVTSDSKKHFSGQCGHHWNTTPISCTECLLSNRCSNCLQFSRYQPDIPLTQTKGSWQLVRYFLESVKRHLNKFGKIPPIKSAFYDISYWITILNGFQSFTSTYKFLPIFTKYGAESQTYSLAKPIQEKLKSEKSLDKLYQFELAVSKIFGGQSLGRVLVLPGLDMSVKFLFGLKESIKIQRYAPGAVLMSGNQLLQSTDDSSKSAIEKTVQPSSSSISLVPLCINAILEALIVDQSLKTAFDEHAASINQFESTPETSSKDVSNGTLDPAQNAVTDKIGDLSGLNGSTRIESSDFEMLGNQGAYKAILVSSNSLIVNYELMAVVLRALTELLERTNIVYEKLHFTANSLIVGPNNRSAELFSVETIDSSLSVSIVNKPTMLVYRASLHIAKASYGLLETNGQKIFPNDSGKSNKASSDFSVMKLLDISWKVSVQPVSAPTTDKDVSENKQINGSINSNSKAADSLSKAFNEYLTEKRATSSECVTSTMKIFISLTLLPHPLFSLFLGYIANFGLSDLRKMDTDALKIDSYSYFMSQIGEQQKTGLSNSAQKLSIQLLFIPTARDGSAQQSAFNYNPDTGTLNFLIMLQHKFDQSSSTTFNPKTKSQFLLLPLTIGVLNGHKVGVTTTFYEKGARSLIGSRILNNQTENGINANKDLAIPDITIKAPNKKSQGYMDLNLLLEKMRNKALELANPSHRKNKENGVIDELSSGICSINSINLFFATLMCLLCQCSIEELEPSFSQ